MLAAALGVAASSGTAVAEKKPKAYRQPGPWMTLAFDRIGVARPSKAFLEAGGSLLTVHFLDDTHLLVTSSLRKLVPRLVGDPVDDDDRLVGARVLELPSGKVLAETEWHAHDHARYLWSLGRGRFLVRIGESLSTMTPLANLKAGVDPLQRVSFPGRPVPPVAVILSEDGRMLTLETPVRVRKAKRGAVDEDEKEEKGQKSTLLDFYRLSGAAEPFAVSRLGSATVPFPMLVPVDGNGYLKEREVSRDRWAISFEPFASRAMELGQVDSTCTPRLEMMSPGEFVAMACKGDDEHVRMISYGLDGHETWEEDLGDFGPPVFAHAAAAGRFAVSNVEQPAVPMPGNAPGPPQQEVRVYQIASGDLLLRVPCSPVFKTAENFDLSADGRQVVVVKDDALVFYRLAAPGKADLEDMAEVAKFTPPEAIGKLELKKMVRGVLPERGPEDVVVPELAEAPPASEPVVVSAPAAAAATPVVVTPLEPKVIANGDDQTERRSPPTLLEPGETTESGAKKPK